MKPPSKKVFDKTISTRKNTNPETWRTVFSRFCNEDRKEIGDIDIDCVESDRPAIFRYITDRFGAEKTARVASFGIMQAKGVIDDVGLHLAMQWSREHPTGQNNPWSLANIARIKSEFDADEESTKQKYPNLFYYMDGLFDTKISQSVHPAGMVVSPITLADNFGAFDKDSETCLLLGLDNNHDDTGLGKGELTAAGQAQIKAPRSKDSPDHTNRKGGHEIIQTQRQHHAAHSRIRASPCA